MNRTEKGVMGNRKTKNIRTRSACLSCLVLLASACTITPGEGNPKRANLTANDRDKGTNFQNWLYVEPAVVKKAGKKPPVDSGTGTKVVTKEEAEKLKGQCLTVNLKSEIKVLFEDLDWPWLVSKVQFKEDDDDPSNNPVCTDLSEVNENPETQWTEAEIKDKSVVIFKQTQEAVNAKKTMYEYIKDDQVAIVYSTASFCVSNPETGEITGTITDNQTTETEAADKLPIDSKKSTLRIGADGKSELTLSYVRPNTPYSGFPKFMYDIELSKARAEDGDPYLIHREDADGKPRPFAKTVLIKGIVDESKNFSGSLEFWAVTNTDPRDAVNCFFSTGGRAGSGLDADDPDSKTTGKVIEGPKTSEATQKVEDNQILAQAANQPTEIQVTNVTLAPPANRVNEPQPNAFTSSSEAADPPQAPLVNQPQPQSATKVVRDSAVAPLTIYSYADLNKLPSPEKAPKYSIEGKYINKRYKSEDVASACAGAAVQISTPSVKIGLSAPVGYDPKDQPLSKAELKEQEETQETEDGNVDVTTPKGKIYLRMVELLNVKHRWTGARTIKVKNKAFQFPLRKEIAKVMAQLDGLEKNPIAQYWELRGCYDENPNKSLLFFHNNEDRLTTNENKKSWYLFSQNHSRMVYVGNNQIVFRALFPRIVPQSELRTLVGNALGLLIPKLPPSNTQLTGTISMNPNTRIASSFSPLGETIVTAPFGPYSLELNQDTKISTDWDNNGRMIDVSSTKKRDTFFAIPSYPEVRLIGDFDVLQLPIEYL